MYDYNKLVSEKIWQELLLILPIPRQRRFGRKRCSKQALLNGILQVLVNGVAWRKIADCGCSYASCFRYFKELQRRGKLKLIYHALAREKTNITEGAIDTTTISSYEFSWMTGWDGNNKKVGTKVSLFADRNGLPADVSFGKGNTEDKDILPKHLKNTVGMRKKLLSLDMKYRSLKLRRELRRKGIKANMKCEDQDYHRKRGPKFRFDEEKYDKRFLLERLNGWLKSFRSITIRREYHFAMFEAFVYLALIIVLIRS
ncbi:IS5 family transposase [Candidatus Gottesmanbacteria bacterium]|nr:IS5 family transposase [Candidatus Gottesmanbacteria bacterium]